MLSVLWSLAYFNWEFILRRIVILMSPWSPDSMCNCKTGFAGYHCEFEGEAHKCELDCYNNGICKIGIKNYDSIRPVLRDYFQLQKVGSDNHCICPTGFTGQQCETRITNCGSVDCLNGSKCKYSFEPNGKKHYYCDCLEAPGPQLYAGLSCESASTSFCDFDVGGEFCTNQGTCPKKM